MRMAAAASLFGLSTLLSAQDALPDGKGRVTLENTCTECHGLDKALRELQTPARWREIAVRMRSKGATMTDGELSDLVEYLSLNFAKPETADSKADKINVNNATAETLERALDLSASAAAAIVRYREANGPFKDWKGVAKVDGVEKAKIEGRKDRLIF